jgi:hypothetical protein
MKVCELMTKKLVTVTQDDMLDKVFIHFYFGGIRHIPVVTAKGTLVGIISDRDTKKMLGPRQTSYVQKDGTVLTVSARKVRTIMRRQPITIGPNESFVTKSLLELSLPPMFLKPLLISAIWLISLVDHWKNKGRSRSGTGFYKVRCWAASTLSG